MSLSYSIKQMASYELKNMELPETDIPKQSVNLDLSYKSLPDFSTLLKGADSNKDGLMTQTEMTSLQSKATYKEFCKKYDIDDSVLSRKINALYNPVAIKQVPGLNKSGSSSEVLVLFDNDGNGVFNKETDELQLIVPGQNYCAICLLGMTRSDDPFIIMAKSAADYDGQSAEQLKTSLAAIQ